MHAKDFKKVSVTEVEPVAEAAVKAFGAHTEHGALRQ